MYGSSIDLESTKFHTFIVLFFVRFFFNRYLTFILLKPKIVFPVVLEHYLIADVLFFVLLFIHLLFFFMQFS